MTDGRVGADSHRDQASRPNRWRPGGGPPRREQHVL